MPSFNQLTCGIIPQRRTCLSSGLTFHKLETDHNGFVRILAEFPNGTLKAISPTHDLNLIIREATPIRNFTTTKER